MDLLFKIQNYINGKLIPPLGNEYIDNYNPAIGKVYSLIPDSDARDVHKAIEAAEQAFPKWGKNSIQFRSDILLKIAQLIEEDIEKLALAESIDNGKPLSLSKLVDIPRAAANYRFFATAILHIATESYANETTIDYELRQPIGTVGCISPWNLPLYLFTWKIAPALAAGNCVIAKPSEMSPMTAFLLSGICKKAGLPPGVLNIIHGYGSKVGAEIISNPRIKAISFTGSTRVGKEIAKIAGPMFKKLSLELGGKNPTIIFADANYSEMLDTTIRSSFSNQGEICFCGSRIYIENSIYDKFKKDFIEKVHDLKVGNPLDPGTKIGAIISKEHKDKIMYHINLAKEEGGTILYGGNEVQLSGENASGYFLQPTVIEGLPHTCRTNQEEIFGPVVTLTPFENEDQVIEYANSTKFGLSAVIWTENLTRAHRIANHLEAGLIWINCWMSRNLNTNFGGMKQSGVGREGGFHALRFFTEPKNITIKLHQDYRFSYRL